MKRSDFTTNFEQKPTIGTFEFKQIDFLDLPDHIIRIDTICSVVKGANMNVTDTELEYYIEIITKNGYFYQIYANESERDNDFNRIKSLLFGCMVNAEGEVLK